jgi:ParB family chromosome partitioning protein
MSDIKKRRMSMLDTISQAGTAAPASMMSSNRALRSARDAVDGHRIWELDPEQITDGRKADRMDPRDVADLRASIEAVGQTVPILVRRDPQDSERYLLVYGRRRLEAVRSSDQVGKVRAMIASMDDRTAIEAQASENTARRDLSFIERALFAQELLESDFGTQAQVAEVLNITKSAVSMALSVARAVGRDLAMAIGPAHGVGRPRWEALVAALESRESERDDLIALAARAHQTQDPTIADPSVAAFDAVSRRLQKSEKVAASAAYPSKVLMLAGRPAGKIQRTKDGLRLDIRTRDSDFADWLEEQAATAIQELHDRWLKRG